MLYRPVLKLSFIVALSAGGFAYAMFSGGTIANIVNEAIEWLEAA
jgi:hypothetical protein